MTDDEHTPQKQNVTQGKFANIDMRIGRILSAARVSETPKPSLRMEVDLGPLGVRVSVGQFALVPDTELIGRNVCVCVNLGEREIGPYVSSCLIMGAKHPDSPADEAQALPLYIDPSVPLGSPVY